METPKNENEPGPKKVGELLAEKSGVLNTAQTTEEAGNKMRDLDADSLPVSEDRKLVGMINEKHPDRKVASFGHDPSQVMVGEHMSRDIIYCFEDQDRAEANRIMTENNVQYLPVVDREMRIVGMITKAEVVD